MSEEHLLRDFSLASPDKLCYQPSTSTETSDPHSQEYLLFFLSGNPGVITFYEPFLSKLHTLRSSSANPRFHICGHSYRGFEIDPQTHPPASPVSLDEQIEYQEKLLYDHVTKHSQNALKPPKVILVGHSVGAYILLELIRRHKEFIDKHDEQDDVDLIGAILLFPTVADIAKSPLGKVARVVLPLPGFARIVGLVARGLSSVMPRNALKRLVRLITRFPAYSASTTTAFIRSPMGVQQALHLAKDEMETITKPKWKDEVWGAATSRGTNKRDTVNWNNVVYWGKDDRWVANETRDEMIRARSQCSPQLSPVGPPVDMRPKMEIDETGVPHDFCTTTRNSFYMATRVNEWIDGLVTAHDRALSR